MISNSYLLSLYGGSPASVRTTSGPTADALARAARKQPTPPWSAGAAATPKPDTLVRAALGGRRLIDEGAARLDLTTASSDYRKLFALYQGLDTLAALANRATVKGLGEPELAQLQRRFAAGLTEVGDWLSSASFDSLRLAQGTVASTSRSTAGVQRDSAVSITGPVHEGAPDAESPAFAGEVRFDIGIRTSAGSRTVAIDLGDMGGAPRTLDAVLTHINDRLEAAGVETRIGRELLKLEVRTMSVGGRVIPLPAGPDRHALVVRGTSSETVSFSAPATSDAVYVVQASGAGSARELLKFQADGGAAPPATPRPGDTQWVEGRSAQTALPPGVDAVRASAVGPDGSLWLVADLTAGPDGQPLKGVRDVALMRLDSVGRVVSTQALGAAGQASGYALAVAPDGRIAVAGSVTGALEPGRAGDVAGVADSFVTVFDAQGAELWTQRRGARAADDATGVVFGADGSIHVAGRSRGAVPGASALGGWDGYVQTFRQTQAHPYAPVMGEIAGVQQFGGAGDDAVAAVAADGTDLYTAGVEDGRLIVRRFSPDPEGRPVLAATRDLGEAAGDVAGLAVSGGRVILAGATRNPALDVATVNAPHNGGADAFVVSLDRDLAPSSADRLTYVGAEGDAGVADMKVVDGKVWLTGVADRPAGAGASDPTRAYLTRIDAASGAQEWRRDWAGAADQAAPMTLAFAAGGASVLDRLGLPAGEIDQSGSKALVDATALRPGDRFYVGPPAGGGRPVAVVIEARDTLQSLARKIEQASQRKLKVTVASDAATSAPGAPAQSVSAGFQRLSITARDGVSGGVLLAGEAGRDALAALGLAAGYVGAAKGDDGRPAFGLDLPRNLALSDPAAVKAAGERLQAAMKAVRDAYRALAPQSDADRARGPVPAYLSAQLSNYQAALARLGG